MLLEMAAGGAGDRIAVGPRSTGTTHEEAARRARKMAAVITAAGVERVCYLGVNTDAVPVLLFATAAAGVPFAPINYRLADHRLRAVVQSTAPSMVIVDEAARQRIEGLEGVQVVTQGELDRRADAAGAADPVDADPVDADPDDVAVWLFTSGTSGEPKAAQLRHRHLVSYVLSTVDFMSSAETDATLVSVPPYHVAGIAAILSATYAGRRLVYLPQFDPMEWVRLADDEDVTHAMVVPTMLGRILDAMERSGAALGRLRHLSYGGGRMPLPTITRAMELLPHVDFVNAYGLTETSSSVAVLGPADHRSAAASDDPLIRARLGSVGRPLPSIELEIRGPGGEPLPPGHSGEIYVRGRQIAGEYRGGSMLSPDGWFATNDGGRLDDGGFLFVEGRLDDVIVRGGENLSPGEIEDTLASHPAVAEAGVTGVPSGEWGETVAAAVVLRNGQKVTVPELQAWVRERLRSARTPVLIDIRRSLPIGDTGKLLRRVLRSELIEKMAAQPSPTPGSISTEQES